MIIYPTASMYLVHSTYKHQRIGSLPQEVTEGPWDYWYGGTYDKLGSVSFVWRHCDQIKIAKCL